MLQLVLKQSKKERRMMRFEDITADPCRVKWANRGTGGTTSD